MGERRFYRMFFWWGDDEITRGIDFRCIVGEF